MKEILDNEREREREREKSQVGRETVWKSEREKDWKRERVKERKSERVKGRKRERRVKVFPSKHLSWKVLIKLFQVMFKILKLWVNHVEYLCYSVFVLYFLQGVSTTGCFEKTKVLDLWKKILPINVKSSH